MPVLKFALQAAALFQQKNIEPFYDLALEPNEC